jgi:hypothetical protein
MLTLSSDCLSNPPSRCVELLAFATDQRTYGSDDVQGSGDRTSTSYVVLHPVVDKPCAKHIDRDFVGGNHLFLPWEQLAPRKSYSTNEPLGQGQLGVSNAAPRCRAKSKRTGLPCRSPAVRGYRVCRMHGARGGAPEGKRNGNFRHGGRTKDATHASRYINELARRLRDIE